jgi:membrane protein DedA with SNARE-associated domain
VPVVGSIIPGSTVIVSLSALISTGDLSLVGVFCAAIFGAAIGDGIAFWLGHRHPRGLRQLWLLNKYPDVVQRSEAFFQKYGSLAVVLGRFVPPVRAFVPITAGALGMTPRRFYPYNLLAILLWAPAHVVPGMLAGVAYQRSGMMSEHVLLPTIAGLIAIGLLIWGVRRVIRR